MQVYWEIFITSKGINRAGEGVSRAGYENNKIDF